jgi:hypothetical protein
MRKKILSEEESKKLFNECIEYPLFVLELTEYEKQKILDIAFDEYQNLIRTTTEFLMYNSDSLKHIPEKDQLQYYLTTVNAKGLRLRILFKNLGFNMGLNSWELSPAEEPQPEGKGQKLNQKQLALLIYFNRIRFKDPQSYNQPQPKIEKLILSYLDSVSDTTIIRVYRFFRKVEKGFEAESEYEKQILTVSDFIKVNPKKLEEYLEKIQDLIIPERQEIFTEYLKQFNLINN